MKLGILGDGQLARMLAVAAVPLDIACVALAEGQGQSKITIPERASVSYLNPEDLARFAQQVDAITFETENIPILVLNELKKYSHVFPRPDIIEIAQHRLAEKSLFQSLGIPTAKFYSIKSSEQLKLALKETGYPAILKTCTGGYDGKGQCVIRSAEEAEMAYQSLSQYELILEAFVPFEREVSLIAVRNSTQIKFYPLTENTHQQGILYISKAPYLDSALQEQAEIYLTKLMEHLDYRGVLTIEFFVVKQQLIANEMAPRVHNSGHWTIEGAYTSQFQNQVRAVLDLPLGETQARCPSAMFNFVGTIPEKPWALMQKQSYFHDYGKTARPKRKLGHFTLLANTTQELEQLIADLSPKIQMDVNYE